MTGAARRPGPLSDGLADLLDERLAAADTELESR
jgi:hypothetical protein